MIDKNKILNLEKIVSEIDSRSEFKKSEIKSLIGVLSVICHELGFINALAIANILYLEGLKRREDGNN